MTTWKFGNYDLSSFGVVTLMDDHLDIPDTRGSDQVIPYQHGAIFVQKYFESRTLLFGITITGETIAIMEGLIEALKRLVAPRSQQTLTKVLLDSTTQTVLAVAESALNPTRPAPHVTKLTLELTLARPFFRGSSLIPDNTTTINASPKAMTVNNPGSMEELDPIITLTGPLTNVTITNSTNGASLTYTGVIDAAEVVTIQTATTGEYTATHSVDGNVIGNVSHAGSPALLPLNIMDNVLSITSSVTTTGTVKVSFYPPYV